MHFGRKGIAVPLVLRKRPDPAVKPWGMRGPEMTQIMGEELEKYEIMVGFFHSTIKNMYYFFLH